MIARDELTSYLDEYLRAASFDDYCPNGLQVEGRWEIRRLACAVTASLHVVKAAIEQGADALLVHHGYFWKGEAAPVTGIKRRRLAALLGADLNLIAYHLPLDAHPEVGNNAVWGARMGWTLEGRFGDMALGCLGTPGEADTGERLRERLQSVLERSPLWIPGDRPIRRVAWCSGGAPGWFPAAIEAGADAYVTGEASEACYHLARESGVHFFAAGHHATERFGVQALGRRLAEEFALEWVFIDEPNPV